MIDAHRQITILQSNKKIIIARNTPMEEKVAAIIDILKDRYPAALCALHYGKD